MIWRSIIGALITLALAVGGWTAMRATESVPRDEYQKRVEVVDERFSTMQKSIDEKMDKIYDHLIKGE